MNLEKKSQIQGLMVSALQEEYELINKNMESQNKKLKWNDEAIISSVTLIVGLFGLYSLSSIVEKTNYDFGSDFNYAIFELIGISATNLWVDIVYTLPLIVSGVFLLASIILGIISIRKTGGTNMRGRMLGIVSTTL